MSTFYIDLDNGSDAADGTTWANAWKTVTGGATAARIAPGDIIRISKTPDPVSIGNAEHYGISLTSLTESFVLGKVRDWLVNTPARKLEKVIFNR